ncbi:uncharacterized protein LOC105646895 isoform X2 [Jatropha curcas]|uniref:uncharacterized protein LOC105646895 isoform X2 n=1 Tax=Jatropha curcas TaxID=180498 RepID=UPI0005FAC60C|nr:uncharacterized protein LOC105646895 isoform X2 [Jatropha curcas]
MDNSKENGFDAEFDSSLSFPAEFPYEFASFGSSSDVGSSETESSDEDDFLAGLARRLTQQIGGEPIKKWVMAGSPESTLSGIGCWSASSNGSPNGELSPPTTPFAAKNDSWELIYEAAGRIDRLKMSNEGDKNCNYQGRGLLGYAAGKIQITGFSSSKSSGHTVPHLNQYQNQVRQNQVVMNPQLQAQPWQGHQIRSRVHPLGLPQSAWPSLQVQSNQHQNQHHQQSHHSSSCKKTPFLGGFSAKRECTGTGVFLPRRYANSSDCNKKSGKVVQAQKSNLEHMNIQNHALNSGFASHHDAMMARRNALMSKQKRNLSHESVLNHEIVLPQEWIY